MKSEIQIQNTAEVCRIDIEGTIGVPEAWQFDDPEARVATYEKFRDAVRRIGQIASPEVVVEIRSTGGDVNDALLIHDALRGLGGRITTRCYGYTASAATIIAQAASEGCREISANALYLIHRASCSTEGNAAELASKIEMLRSTDERLAAVYAARSGREAAQFEALMGENNGAGRWLSPEEAVAAGLADKVVGAAEEAFLAPSGSVAARAGSLSAQSGSVAARAGSFARGWERFKARIGLGTAASATAAGAASGAALSAGELPEDRNILHFEEDERELRRRSLAAASEALCRIAPTETLPREDPSASEPMHTPNERAYAEDARRFRN